MYDKKQISLMLPDPEEVITVVAHSAMRCDFIERMAESMRPTYPKMKFLGTCECDEEDTVCDETPVAHR